jgi:hypothetical protein
MNELERVAFDLLYIALEHVRLLFGETGRDDLVGVIVGQVCELQHSLAEYWRGELTPREDDELPF